MLRAFFFAGGLFIAMWGITFTMVDQMVFTWKEPPPQRDPEFRGFFTKLNDQRQPVLNPPQWAAFTLMSIGTVTMLYSVALPKPRQN